MASLVDDDRMVIMDAPTTMWRSSLSDVHASIPVAVADGHPVDFEVGDLPTVRCSGLIMRAVWSWRLRLSALLSQASDQGTRRLGVRFWGRRHPRSCVSCGFGWLAAS